MDMFRSSPFLASKTSTPKSTQELPSASDGLQDRALQIPAMNDVIDTMLSGHHAMMNEALRGFDNPSEMLQNTKKALSGEPYRGESYAMSYVSATGAGMDGKPHRAFESRHLYDNSTTGEQKRAHARGIDDQ